MSLIDFVQARRKSALADMDPPEQAALVQVFTSYRAWEAGVLCASDPIQTIHFNGDKFLSPHAVEAS